MGRRLDLDHADPGRSGGDEGEHRRLAHHHLGVEARDVVEERQRGREIADLDRGAGVEVLDVVGHGRIASRAHGGPACVMMTDDVAYRTACLPLPRARRPAGDRLRPAPPRRPPAAVGRVGRAGRRDRGPALGRAGPAGRVAAGAARPRAGGHRRRPGGVPLRAGPVDRPDPAGRADPANLSGRGRLSARDRPSVGVVAIRPLLREVLERLARPGGATGARRSRSRRCCSTRSPTSSPRSAWWCCRPIRRPERWRTDCWPSRPSREASTSSVVRSAPAAGRCNAGSAPRPASPSSSGADGRGSSARWVTSPTAPRSPSPPTVAASPRRRPSSPPSGPRRARRRPRGAPTRLRIALPAIRSDPIASDPRWGRAGGRPNRRADRVGSIGSDPRHSTENSNFLLRRASGRAMITAL